MNITGTRLLTLTDTEGLYSVHPLIDILALDVLLHGYMLRTI